MNDYSNYNELGLVCGLLYYNLLYCYPKFNTKNDELP